MLEIKIHPRPGWLSSPQVISINPVTILRPVHALKDAIPAQAKSLKSRARLP